MKFTVNQKLFSATLARIQGIAGPRAGMPILANVLLSASGVRTVLHVTATDLETGYATVIDCCDIEDPGSITLPAKKLHEVIKAAPTAEVTLTLDPGNLRVTVEAGTFVTTLAGMGGDEFPEVVPVPGEALQLDAEALLRLLGHVDYARANDATKYHLCGVHLRVSDDGDGCCLHAAATDGHRLAVDSVPLPGDPRVIPPDLLRGIIIPRKGIAELRKISAEGILLLQLAGNNLSFSTESETITLRLVDGQFPDVSRIVVGEPSGEVEIHRQPLIDALGRVSLLSEGKTHGVDLIFGEGRLDLLSSNVELGNAEDRITAAIEGKPIDRRLNASYLVQALSALDCGDVRIRIGGEFGPIQITPICEEEPYAIIMPLRG